MFEVDGDRRPAVRAGNVEQGFKFRVGEGAAVAAGGAEEGGGADSEEAAEGARRGEAPVMGSGGGELRLGVCGKVGRG